MSTISDALRTEVLYCDGNPDYIVPVSALSFMTEAAEVLEAQDARISELEQELAQALSVHRWTVDPDGTENLSICRGEHDKADKCEWEVWVPKTALTLSKAPSIK